MRDNRNYPLITAAWPKLADDLVDPLANAELDWVVRLVTQVRAIRNEMNIPAKAIIPLMLKEAGELAQTCIVSYAIQIKRLARLTNIELLDGDVPKGAVQDVLDEAILILPVADVIDIAAEEKRLQREISKMNSEIQRFEGKLSNERFIANAPGAVVETEREKLNDAKAAYSNLIQARERLMTAR